MWPLTCLPDRMMVGRAVRVGSRSATAERGAAFAVAALILQALPADAQITIKVSDDVSFSLGVLGQFQAEAIDLLETDDDPRNLFVRRLRLILGGQVARNVTFFIETDAPNLGKALPGGKNIQPAVIIQDAFATFAASDAFMVDGGLMFVPFSRNSLQSAASLLAIDYGAYTFAQSAPTSSATGRDTGFQARGYLAGGRVEYRAGAFQGRRDATSSNSLRYVARAQVNVLEPEVGFFYTGTYLGRRRVLAFGAALDRQSDFRAYAGDAFSEIPLGAGAFTGRVDYRRLDGAETFLTLPRQDDVLVEAGYLIRAARLTPVLQWQRRDVDGRTEGDETRASIGVNFWWAGHNANVKFAYMRISPRGQSAQHAFTLQLQAFSF